MAKFTSNTVADIHYSCSNNVKSRHRPPEPRNFYFMTIEELVAYWAEMDEKFALQELKEKKFLPRFDYNKEDEEKVEEKIVEKPKVIESHKVIKKPKKIESCTEVTTSFSQSETDDFVFEDDSEFQFEDDSQYEDNPST